MRQRAVSQVWEAMTAKRMKMWKSWSQNGIAAWW